MTKIRLWGFGAAVVVVIVVAAGWLVAISPQRHHVSDLQASVSQQQQANQALTDRITRLNLENKDDGAKASAEASLSEIQRLIPPNPDMSLYVRKLGFLAVKNNIALEAVTPAQPVAVTATVKKTPAANASAGSSATANSGTSAHSIAKSSGLSAINVNLSVVGDYADVENFIGALQDPAQIDRTTVISQITMSLGADPRVPPDTTIAPWQQLATNISLTVFTTSAPGAAGAGPGVPAQPTPASAKPTPTASASDAQAN